MEACAVRPSVDFAGIISFVTTNHTKSSYSGVTLVPYERNTKTLLRSLDDPKISLLREKIKAEMLCYPQYLPEDRAHILDLTNELSTVVASMEYEKVAVELTPSSTLKFKFTLSEGKRLIITKPLDSDDLSREEVVFSIFFNKDLLVSDVKNINELVQGINEFYKKQAFDR